MQYVVKNLITDLVGRGGISGPIPNITELKAKREQNDKGSDREDAVVRRAPSLNYTIFEKTKK
jgi:hypothetical protein